MSRTLSILLAILACGLLLSACGNDETKRFEQSYTAQRTQLRALGNDIGSALANAGKQTDTQLASEFTRLGDRLEQANKKLETLKPPEEVKAEFARLQTSLDKVERDLRGVAGAGTAHDPKQAAQSATQLVLDAQSTTKAREAVDAKLKQAK